MNINSIKRIKDLRTLAHFLSDELNWPIDPENVDVEDLVFDYTPEDIGLSEEYATKVLSIKQIRPLNSNQPWSVFWIDFENKKLPLTVLRRILNVFVTKNKGNARNIATKALEDIMFISGHGEDKNRAITFAHFKRLDDVETIREFDWDGHETKFDNITSYLEKLKWPTNTTDVNAWREQWKSAFTGSTREAIYTSDQLAKAMAKIAQNIRGRVKEVLEIENTNGPVHKLYNTFRAGLVHDMTIEGFADMYAQTITYGLFSARTMDTDGHFELHEVIDLIPQTNPFLKNLFKECIKTGNNKHKIDLDELGVGSLVDLFDNLNRTDGSDTMQRILEQFGSQTHSGKEDPVIHFYEGFLCAYDNIQRVDKGVYYTPDPVVSFIVRSVNDQLKSEFGLEMGLADTTTWAEMVATGRAEYPVDPKTGKLNNEWKDKIKGRAFVQILDPATGTGTFLKHVIEIIHEEVIAKHKREKNSTLWLDYWNDYVFRSLLPRVYGFELMMASYSVAHMKLGLYLKSLGYRFENDRRLNIYLTNSLEPYTTGSQINAFSPSIGAESAGANDLKKDRYFSVVLGNPPYSSSSNNKSEWIQNLIVDYKKNLNERKINLDDDYIKFTRYGQQIIDLNCTGILAFISNSSFIEGTTHRQMRKHLLASFNNIYILDLHGNANKKETTPDGNVDQNVFDIMQGVSINIFIKTNKKQTKELGEVFHHDLYGKREFKYEFLLNSIINNVEWMKLDYTMPNMFFIPKDFTGINEYETGFILSKLFNSYSIGIESQNDSIAIQFDIKILEEILNDFRNLPEDELVKKYNLKDGRDWKVSTAKKDVSKKYNIVEILYRPFDIRITNYSGTSKGFHAYPRNEVLRNLLNPNYSLTSVKLNRKYEETTFFISNKLTDKSIASSLDNSTVFPLYIYSDNLKNIDLGKITERTPNLNSEIVTKIANDLGLYFMWEKGMTNSFNNKEVFAPIDILDYIYAILHSPSYRKKYKEFLKIDFPRVPYPKDKEIFLQLVKLGGEIRQIHLLESNKISLALRYKSNRINWLEFCSLIFCNSVC